MGPDLLARLLGLTPVQTGVLNIVFRIADDGGLLLIDLKDLRAMLAYVAEHRDEYTPIYGNMAPQTIAAITRALLPLESQGGDLFFGEPALDIFDWIRTDSTGKGIINILNCVKLVQNPTLYATFMLWLMAELFECLPEVGDMEKPKLVFFFDEAHLLFSDTPKVLVQKIEQMVKLIRSKGVGIYFVTQSPSDIPDCVLAQLSNRVQHALRAYTPAEQKAVRTAAQSFRSNPSFKTEDVIMEMGVGEALVSLLDADGIPSMVQRTAIICPQSLMAQASSQAVQAARASDQMAKYDTYVDNESAYELLDQQRQQQAEQDKLNEERARLEKEKAEFEEMKRKQEEAALKKAQKEAEREEAARRKAEERAIAARERAAEQRKKQIERQLINMGGQIIKRGLMNTIFGQKRR